MSELTDKEIAVQPENTEVVISAENVSKKFCRDLKRSLIYGLQDIATELVGDTERVRLRDQTSFGH